MDGYWENLMAKKHNDMLLLLAAMTIMACSTYSTHAVGQSSISADGVIESQSGGFKFPDGSMQLSAAVPPCIAITYVPFEIIEEGVYCFTGNLETTDQDGITISADNVTINLNGWTLDGLSSGNATTSNGIFAYQRKNITIRNGTIRGYLHGIFLDDESPYTTSQGHLIEDIRSDKNTMRGIAVNGRDYIIRRNHVIDTGGTSQPGIIVGIILVGPSGHVLNNDISKTSGRSTHQARALYLFEAHGSLVEGNRIDDVSSEVGATLGIRIQNSNDVLVRGNNITNMSNGISYFSSTGKYMNNLTSNVTVPFSGDGTAVGIND